MISAKQGRNITSSLTETYSIASSCRSKLGKEARRADHELRLLVLHANMLDTLMDELMEAQRATEGGFNALIRAARKPKQSRNVQWLDTIAEELEEAGDGDCDTYSDDDIDFEAEINYKAQLRKLKSPPPKLTSEYFDDEDELSEDDEESDGEADDQNLVLIRWPSKFKLPELMCDSDSGSEDEDSFRSCADDACLAGFAKQCSIATKTARDDFETHGTAESMAPTIVVH